LLTKKKTNTITKTSIMVNNSKDTRKDPPKEGMVVNKRNKLKKEDKTNSNMIDRQVMSQRFKNKYLRLLIKSKYLRRKRHL
jgi:hypothetical protein